MTNKTETYLGLYYTNPTLSPEEVAQWGFLQTKKAKGVNDRLPGTTRSTENNNIGS